MMVRKTFQHLESATADPSLSDPKIYEVRAIALSKMGQHRQALDIYVFKLQDSEKAEE